jgi:hypothetical protein
MASIWLNYDDVEIRIEFPSKEDKSVLSAVRLSTAISEMAELWATVTNKHAHYVPSEAITVHMGEEGP